MTLRLEHKNAIVTGSARGIGKAIARKFLQEGAKVLLVDKNAERLPKTAEELTAFGTVEYLAGDLTDPAFCETVVRKAQTAFGEIHVLANDAGIAIVEPFLEHSIANWDATLNINLRAMFVLSQITAKVMVSQGKGGAIVNMASSNGHMGEKGLAAYNASKAGVVLLTKTMAIELAEHNIRVNAVSPGFIYTELLEQAGLSPEYIQKYLDKIPLNRYGKPEEVANLFAFLASDEASFITGDSVIIDGGQLSEE